MDSLAIVREHLAELEQAQVAYHAQAQTELAKYAAAIEQIQCLIAKLEAPMDAQPVVLSPDM